MSKSQSHLDFANQLESEASEFSPVIKGWFSESAERIRQLSTPIYDLFMVVDNEDFDVVTIQRADGAEFYFDMDECSWYQMNDCSFDFHKFIDDHSKEMLKGYCHE